MANARQWGAKWEWNFVKNSVLFFLLWPELAGVGLLIVSIRITRKNFSSIIQTPLNWGLALLSIWLIVTVCFSPRPVDAFLGLGNFLPFFFLFINLSQIIQKPSQLRQLAWRLIIPSLFVVILGLGQLFAGWETPQLLLPILQLIPYGRPIGRMSSIFMYANSLAIYLLLMLILSLGLLIDTYRQKKDRSWHLGFLSIVVLMDSIGLVLTHSRNAWGLAFLACFLFAFYLGWRWLVVGISLLSGSVTIASWGPTSIRDGFRRFIPAYFWARLSDEMYQDRPLATLRSTQWQFAWEMTIQRPFIGWGLRNFTPMYKSQMGVWLGHPHNLFLMLMAETGIIGLLFFCGWVGWIYWQGIKVLNSVKNQRTSHGSAGAAKPVSSQSHLLFFTYLVAFGGCVLFNTLDVTVLDGEVNTISWIILSAIAGIILSAKKTIDDKLSG